MVTPTHAEKVAVEVTASSGRSMYLNAGRKAGIAPGQRVRVVSNGRTIEGVVIAVTGTSARVDLLAEIALPEVGARGEVEIPDEVAPKPGAAPLHFAATQPATTQPAATQPAATQPASTQPASTRPAGTQPGDGPPASQPAGEVIDVTRPGAPGGGGDRKTPVHPAWPSKTDPADPDAPLLAPVSRRPEERPTKITGRVATDIFVGHNMSPDNHRNFLDSRLTLSIDVTNPFGQGGRLQFLGIAEGDYRELSSGSETNLKFNPELFSYAIGGEDYSPYRFEIGRFYSYYVPELGLLDGAEGALIFQNGVTLGAGAGFYTVPFSELDWGTDYGFHLFANYETKKNPGLFSATVAYQKTWHDGAPDRDQITGRFNYHPIKPLWLNGSFRADIYTGGDTLKGAGIELTEAWGQARYAVTDKWTVSGTYSRYTWPELKNSQFNALPPELVMHGRVDRAEASTSYDLTKSLRLGARLNYWIDQDGDGSGGEIDADWTPDWIGPTLHAAIYQINGPLASGTGGRIELRKNLGKSDAFLGYEAFQYQTSTGFGSSNLLRNTVRGGVSWRFKQWYYSASTDYNFGDGQDAISLNLHAEYRF
ncbi:MAG: hypothetical protein NTW19_10440 [Planctomycetota bacterium]|nr:hypothetical protein [Planctomycetota bacterium]